MIDFLQFTYKNDEELTKVSVESIFKNCSEIGTVIILNDNNNPISDKTINFLISNYKNIKVINTKWNRNGNLIGEEHFFNYIKTLKALKDNGILKGNTVVKIDPDAIIIKDRMLREFNESNNFYGGDFIFSEWYAIGPFYWFKSEMIDLLYWSLNHWGVWSNNEDVEFGHRIICLYHNLDLRFSTTNFNLEELKNIDKRYNEFGNLLFTDSSINLDLIKNNNIELISVGNNKNGNSKERQKECLEKILKLE